MKINMRFLHPNLADDDFKPPYLNFPDGFFQVIDFTSALHGCLSKLMPWVEHAHLERAVYYYFWNLIDKSKILSPKSASKSATNQANN